MSILSYYEATDKAFRSGTVLNESNEKLLTYLHGLSNQNNTNSGTQHRDIIRGITINHILLQRHIDSLNKQDSKTQKLVIVLAVAALLSSVVQIFSPLLFQSPPTASAKQTPATQSVSPSQVQPQASGQATKKVP
jgi:hypothetical protein